MKEAIQKAIEGGWLPLTVSEWTDECELKRIDFETWSIEEPMHDIITGQPLKPLVHKFEIYKLLLDPLFWHALGTATKWPTQTIVSTNGVAEAITSDNEPWFDVWHAYIDHLAENKDPEEFFKTLLTPNN